MKNEELRDQYHLETGEKWENSEGKPDIDYVQWMERKIIARQYNVSGSLPPDTTGWLIHHNDKVNSVLGAALRFLDEEQLICLRDCLIKRTPGRN